MYLQISSVFIGTFMATLIKINQRTMTDQIGPASLRQSLDEYL